MILEMNTRDFHRVKNAYDDALELYEQSLYKEARLEMRQALKILERTPIRTPLHGKCYALFSEILEKLGDQKQAEHYLKLSEDYYSGSESSCR